MYLNALENGDVDTYRVILDNDGHIDHNLGLSGNALISALRHKHDALLEFLFANSAMLIMVNGAICFHQLGLRCE